jgi:hypothetical protein
MKKITTASCGAQGRYKVAIVDSRTGKEIWKQKEWKKNLILNNGLDSIAARTWAASFTHASAGTGIEVTSISSGAITASKADSANVIASAAIFAAGDVGNTIKWDGVPGGLRITSFVSSTEVAVHANVIRSSGTFVIYKTNQTGLGVEVKRTNTYLLGDSAFTGYTVVPPVTGVSPGMLKLRRTFDFSAETGIEGYNELGLCWAASGPNTHFSRIVLDDTLNLVAGQQLRLFYELIIQMSPTEPSSLEPIIAGWPVAPSVTTAGVQQFQTPSLHIVGSSGVAQSLGIPSTGFDTSEPSISTNNRIGLSPNSTAHNQFGTAGPDRSTNGASKLVSLSTYTSLNFYRDKLVTFAVGEANRSDWRSVFLGNSSGGFNSEFNTGQGLVFIFDENQAKNSTQTLNLVFRLSWDRMY